MPQFIKFDPSHCRHLPACEYAPLLQKLADLRKKHEAALEANRGDKSQVTVEEELKKQIDQLGGEITTTLDACGLAGSLGAAACVHQPRQGRGRKI